MTSNDHRPLVAFYGDDVTGSTDALETLAGQGIDTLLFLNVPSPQEATVAARRYAAVGIAGTSRAKGVDWMDAHLPAMFRALRAMQPYVAHYKVCSTFDSAPGIGNIGRAVAIGRAVFEAGKATPIIVGTPALGRYTVFGNLFARAEGAHYRIDRHPTMARHPVTPMHEADLRRHLAAQTPLRCGLIDPVDQVAPDAQSRFDAALDQWDMILIDVLDDRSQQFAGGSLWALAQAGSDPVLAVGSSGVGAALIAHWREAGTEDVGPRMWTAQPEDRIAVVSGSCSPVTAGQIAWAGANGFDCIRADPCALVMTDRREAEVGRLVAAALQTLDAGASPLVFSAAGPDDPAIAALGEMAGEHGMADAVAQAAIGAGLGKVLSQIIVRAGLRRVAVAGGDTSGEVVAALGLRALAMRAALSPGAPLCDGLAGVDDPPVVEIALKGGQMGPDNYFGAVRHGAPL